MGIEPEFQDRMLSLIDKLDSKGIKRGIPLVKRLVEPHGGKI